MQDRLSNVTPQLMHQQYAYGDNMADRCTKSVAFHHSRQGRGGQ